ncbi:Radical SAM domain protein [Methanosalsum zhilinae DSM 4017]|uniref:Radical SAM domain protein n=1 Tax=Methanosalsum zhilinae (strain DSM 4017 / NBRC 107636 / OCM 62 / WeN5) TaxID=679901 RepID=F7XMW1_METZD|nr:radical SAM protein [Methanosalsum zhilinae]AEH59978.1 Radical SAM domain protein [Methanosalsum zhilinae DSM 4017]
MTSDTHTSGFHRTLQERIRLLSAGTKYDSCNQTAVCHAFGPDGRCIQLYKTLLTNHCSGECLYCPNRSMRDTARASLSPEEIAKITWSFYRKNTIEGLFLSSGIIGDPENTAYRQLEVVTLLREQGFNGYIHVRLMPGTPKHLLETISEYANKFGINAETTSSVNYSHICPNFDYQNDVLMRLRWIHDMVRRRRCEHNDTRIIGANDTQFVVGLLNESDRNMIQTVNRFMNRYGLRRPYFMSFDPVPGTPLEKEPSSPRWKETRLYQASYLLKDYGLKARDFDPIFDDIGNLTDDDPKILLAAANPDMYPVDINSANRHELLMVPGIGPVSAERIIHADTINSEQELARLGVAVSRARPYIIIQGKSQTRLDHFWRSGS